MTIMTPGQSILERWNAKRGQEPISHWSHEGSRKRIPLLEMFGPTIEGEGAVIGKQTFFLRLAGCDYKCTMCDSLHAVLPQLFANNVHMLTGAQIGESLVELIEKVAPEIKRVVLTGGNPCMWDLTQFFDVIDPHDIEVLLETQGTRKPSWLGECDHVTISPKGPGFGEKFEEDKFMEFVQACHQVSGTANIKIVLFDMRDLDFAEHVMSLDIPKWMPVYLSIGNPDTPWRVEEHKKQKPDYDDSRSSLVEGLLNRYRIMLEEVFDRPKLANAIILPQMHVLLWGNQPEV